MSVWTAKHNGAQWLIMCDGRRMAELPMHFSTSKTENKRMQESPEGRALAHRAKLLSLAPEMAKALRDILAAHDWPTEPHWTQARSLLARLEGGEK